MLKQHSKIIQGIDKEISQLINKTLKSSKLKVQVAIRGDEVRVTGNKRDNLQEAIQLIKDLNIKQPLQYKFLGLNWHNYFIKLNMKKENDKIKKMLGDSSNSFVDKLASIKYITKKDSKFFYLQLFQVY